MKNSKSKLLCPECGELIGIADHNKVTDTFTLICGHTRTEILPAKGISLEHAYTPLGHSLFPVSWSGERSTQRTWL